MANIKYWIIDNKTIEGVYNKTDDEVYIEATDGKKYQFKSGKGYDTRADAEYGRLVADVKKKNKENRDYLIKTTAERQLETESVLMNEFDDDFWKEYLLEDLNLKGIPYDTEAVCFVDGSFEDNKMKTYKDAEGSFGLIILPVNDKKEEEILIESCHAIDISKSEFSFKQTFYDCQGQEKVADSTSKVDLGELEIKRKDSSYLGKGWADGMEFEGAIRVLDLCMSKGYKVIAVVCDCDNVLKKIVSPLETKKSDSIAVPRFLAKYKKFMEAGGRAYAVEVGSHDKARIEPFDYMCRPSEEPQKENWIVGNRFCHVMNDMVDLMAKAELAPKTNGSYNENKVLLHILPNKVGNELKYKTFKDKSEIDKIYSEEDRAKRRVLTREFCERINNIMEKVRAQ